MPMTKEAAAKLLEKDPDYFSRIGKRGGYNSRGGGFAADKELARKAGKKGGETAARNRRMKDGGK